MTVEADGSRSPRSVDGKALSSATEKGITAMIESTSATKDPVCGMTVDESTALHAERDGETFYFCSDHCRQAFVSTPAADRSEDTAAGR